MTKLQTNFAAALVLLVGASGFSAQASAGEFASTATARCNHTLTQYVDYAKQLRPFADRARQQAEDNPLFLADAGYYNAELSDAQQCVKNLAPIATASR